MLKRRGDGACFQLDSCDGEDVTYSVQAVNLVGSGEEVAGLPCARSGLEGGTRG